MSGGGVLYICWVDPSLNIFRFKHDKSSFGGPVCCRTSPRDSRCPSDKRWVFLTYIYLNFDQSIFTDINLNFGQSIFTDIYLNFGSSVFTDINLNFGPKRGGGVVADL